jgi:hypothetical protein
VTEQNKKENVVEEIGKATTLLGAADLLFANGYINDAISRLYYCLFYHVRALLLTEGIEPKSHEAALRLLGLHFVKKGVMEPKISHLLAKLMKYREEADYNPGIVFTEEDFLIYRQEAMDAAGQIYSHLKERGYLSGSGWNR